MFHAEDEVVDPQDAPAAIKKPLVFLQALKEKGEKAAKEPICPHNDANRRDHRVGQHIHAAVFDGERVAYAKRGAAK